VGDEPALNLLLDTHVWLWTQFRREAFSESAMNLLRDASSRRWVSTMSSIEIARLRHKNAIEIRIDLEEWIESSLAALHTETLPVSHKVAAASYDLPGQFHGDPADRVIVATARCHGLSVLTADKRILSYPHVSSISAA
jgi:PIN domain nuclease of toxin-antitoxin system